MHAEIEKIVVVTRKTQLQELVQRMNSKGQARFYLEHLEQESLTNEINAALDLIGDDDDSAAAAVSAGRRTLESADDEW